MRASARSLALVPLLFLSLSAGAFDLQLVKTPSAADDAKAKRFEPDPAVARVYAFRDNAFLGKTLKSNVVIANKIVATTGAGQFAILSLKPGAYDLQCVSSKENSNVLMGLVHNRTKPPLQLTVEAGKIYFIQEVFRGAAGFTLTPVDRADAEPLIKKGKLVQDVPPPSD